MGRTAPSWKSTEVVVVAYLAAIVAANLLVSGFGQAALTATAFLLIPFDLTTRDVLHQRWSGPRLWFRMGALILAGSALTAALNVGASRIALASFVAFLVSGTGDAVVFTVALRRGKTRLEAMNLSNAVGAVLDSILFPVIAFAHVSPWLCTTQAVSKFVGGAFWSWLFVRYLFKPTKEQA